MTHENKLYLEDKTLEQFLLQHWFSIGLVLLAVGGLCWRQKALEFKIEKHLNPDNLAPHPQCVVHNERFKAVVDNVAEVKDEVKYVSRTLYNFLSSQGHKIPEPPNGHKTE